MKYFLFVGLTCLIACTPIVTNICPPLAVYSQKFNHQLAGEVEKLPKDSLVLRVLADYINLRDQIRACY